MSHRQTFYLEPDKGRTYCLDRAFDHMANLPRDRRYTVSVEEWHPPLARNLEARLHIPIRDLANFCGYSERDMKVILKWRLWPRVVIEFMGESMSVPISTKKLSPEQARNVERMLHDLGSELHCPMSTPRGTL